MKRDYHSFKKEVLTRDNYTCRFCGTKAQHMLFLDPHHKVYCCVPYQLILDAMKSVCLRCYYKKLNSTTKKASYRQKKWTNKK